jgi:ethanolamine ammonia-lyase large subunit
MYADDAAIFINPIKDDLDSVTTILWEFGMVSSLHINLQKNSVHPIRCQDIDLDLVLASFAGTRESFL